MLFQYNYINNNNIISTYLLDQNNIRIRNSPDDKQRIRGSLYLRIINYT